MVSSHKIYSAKVENRLTRPVMVEMTYETEFPDKIPGEKMVQYIEPGRSLTFARKAVTPPQGVFKHVDSVDMYLKKVFITSGEKNKTTLEEEIRTDQTKDRMNYIIVENSDDQRIMLLEKK